MSSKESVYQMNSTVRRFRYPSQMEPRHEFIKQMQLRAFAPQPNWGFNADANMGHAFGIFMAHVGTLRTSCSGAG
jgi:hypothetical protein